MPASLSGFEIKEIWRIHTDPDIFAGEVEMGFLDKIDGKEYGQSVTVQLRIKHSRAESVESLERAFLEAARDLLTVAAQSVREETAESLHKRTEVRLFRPSPA